MYQSYISEAVASLALRNKAEPHRSGDYSIKDESMALEPRTFMDFITLHLLRKVHLRSNFLKAVIWMQSMLCNPAIWASGKSTVWWYRSFWINAELRLESRRPSHGWLPYKQAFKLFGYLGQNPRITASNSRLFRSCALKSSHTRSWLSLSEIRIYRILFVPTKQFDSSPDTSPSIRS